MTSLSGAPLTTLQLAERVIGAVAFVTVSMLGVAAIALFLSTITDSALGAALGSLAALAATRLLATLLFRVRPYDPFTFGAVALLLAAVAVAACLIPAVRAARIDPMVALSHE